MKELHNHYQEKIGRKRDLKSTCNVELYLDGKHLYYSATYDFISTLKTDKSLPHRYFAFSIDIENGDFESTVDNVTSDKFNTLYDVCYQSFINGGRKSGFWGLEFKKSVDEIFEIVKELVFQKNKSNYFYKKTEYHGSYGSAMFQLLVDFYLFKKKIKPHDNVYLHVNQVTPKKKYLKLNNNKYLPSILEQLNIKSKYFIKVLSSHRENNTNLKALQYLCHLFGENHLDYIREFHWLSVCKVQFTPKKLHTCNDTFEKRTLLNLIKYSISKESKTFTILENLYTFFELKIFFESKNLDFKFKVSTAKDLSFLIEEWTLLKKNVNKGYMLKHSIPQSIIDHIEEPIVINSKVFKPKLLNTENDFILEGIRMKNCLGGQFTHGAVHFYISLSLNGKKVNLQYRKNELSQSFGKANTKVKQELFKKPIQIMTERLEDYKDLTWGSEKILF